MKDRINIGLIQDGRKEKKSLIPFLDSIKVLFIWLAGRDRLLRYYSYKGIVFVCISKIGF